MLILALVAAALLLPGESGAQTAYPQKPVQVIVGFSAGGSVDVMARTLVNAISAQLGQSFVIVNRDGASGSIGFARSSGRWTSRWNSAYRTGRSYQWK